jgi:hypothetical protein
MKWFLSNALTYGLLLGLHFMTGVNLMINFLRVCLVFSLFPLTVSAAELALDPNSFFDANFTIDSTYTSDGKTYQVSASGEAGPYGRVYLSYEFTDKQDLGDRGEYTGHAWTQNGETIATATLQGIYVKNGALFKLYGLNTLSDGKFHYAIGHVDFVAQTMTFKVADILTAD